MASMTITAPARVRPAPVVAGPVRQVRPVRLTRRGRRLLRTLVVLLALIATMVVLVGGRGGISQAGESTAGPVGPATRLVVVQPGQTLWAIASSALPQADQREAVRRVADLNNLTPGATLVPGQPLVLPIAG